MINNKFTQKIRAIIKNNSIKNNNWDNFSQVEILSSYDGVIQKAFFYRTANDNKMPLIISLHPWSLNYTARDPISNLIKNEDWNYIHPDFRGPNNTPNAMMSDAVIQDIDDSIAYAVNNSNVDLTRIIVVGSSGGGLAVLGVYLKSKYQLKLCMAWCPISDLEIWYYQSRYANTKYYQDILRATNSVEILNTKEARNRSPIYYPPRTCNTQLELYAGINDGYTGSVPIIHTIAFFNKIAESLGAENDEIISDKETISLISRSIKYDENNGYIDNRRILYKKSYKTISMCIFDGGHEILEKYAYTRIKEICSMSY